MSGPTADEAGRPAAGRSRTTTLTIYATSDLHAHWRRDDGGIGRVLSHLAGRDPAASLVIDNGDLLTGAPLGAFLADRYRNGPHPILAALDEAGFDVAVPGNHDVDHGIDRLRDAVAHLRHTRYVCANCLGPDGSPVFNPSVTLERAGLRVGVIGAVTGHTQRLSRYDVLRGVRFVDPVAAVREEARRLSGSVDVLIVAYHGGFSTDPESGTFMYYPTGEDQAWELVQLEGIDAVVAGHQHVARAGVARAGRVGYVQPGYGGSHVGRLRFILDDAERTGRRTLRCIADVVPMTGVEVAMGPLAAEEAAAAAWLRQSLTVDPMDLHRMVAARVGGPTALALRGIPGTVGEILEVFPGLYGASRVRLPEPEFAAGMTRARQAGYGISSGGWELPAEPDPDADISAVVNATLRDFLPTGRVEQDLVVDWLDELVFARTRGVLADGDAAPRTGRGHDR